MGGNISVIGYQWRGLLADKTKGRTYLWVFEAFEVRIQVELDARRSTWQSYAADQQDDKHDKWECGRDVDNLK